ncbi:hypothetical protein NPIL_343411, partial [Nephila pilipes]
MVMIANSRSFIRFLGSNPDTYFIPSCSGEKHLKSGGDPEFLSSVSCGDLEWMFQLST